MGKKLFIAEKPSVAKEFARVLKVNGKNADGYIESDDAVVTWCVGHLVTMSYPEEYDPALKKWSLQALPFLPAKYKYQVIDSVKKQFDIVSGLLNRNDIDTIYVCTDSGREGEYIYRLVDDMAGVPKEKVKKRVWIDSQTEEEILKGINTAKDLSEYDHLAASAYLRAKEDYLMGINFSRLLSLKFGPVVSKELGKQYVVLSIGRVMTCVLGMVVRREREIRDFVKTVFYRILGQFVIGNEKTVTCDWKVNEKSLFYAHPGLYKDNGFLKEEDADKLISFLLGAKCGRISGIEKKKEKKNAPLLYNLAEIQNDCSKRFKISPDQTLAVIQELYEKKLVTYPRTDARVLSTAVAKEIEKNLRGLTAYGPLSENAKEVMEMGSYKGIANTKYTNDKQITDHYAIIPTGQGFGALSSLSDRSRAVYDLIVKRFLAIFYPPAEYKKISLSVEVSPDESHTELFTASFKTLEKEGYLKVAGIPSAAPKKDAEEEDQDIKNDPEMLKCLDGLKKGDEIGIKGFNKKEGETSPPSRYNSGSLILAMENAGQLIEDEELRALIKSSGIGTSATRAEILKKLVTNQYLSLNNKTQIFTPTYFGELLYEVVLCSMPKMLDAEMTASWEKGLSYVADGSITPEEYEKKLASFISARTAGVKNIRQPGLIAARFNAIRPFYASRSKGR